MVKTTKRNANRRLIAVLLTAIGIGLLTCISSSHAFVPITTTPSNRRKNHNIMVSSCSQKYRHNRNDERSTSRLGMDMETANAETDEVSTTSSDHHHQQQDHQSQQPPEQKSQQTQTQAPPLQRGKDNIYSLSTPADLKILLFQYCRPNQLVVMKVHAPWCQTCKVMAPKFQQLSRNKAYNKNKNNNVVFAEFTNRDHPSFVKHVLEVTAVPTVLLFRAPSSVPLSMHPFGTRDKMQSLTDELALQLSLPTNKQQQQQEEDLTSEISSASTTTNTTTLMQRVMKPFRRRMDG